MIYVKNGLNEKEAQKYFFQISKSIYFLHKNDVIHRDIKPENILLDENNNIKLCDFGWSVILKERLTRNTFCGTLEYMAPEIINNENYEKSIDIWSLGVLLYEILNYFKKFLKKKKKDVVEGEIIKVKIKLRNILFYLYYFILIII